MKKTLNLIFVENYITCVDISFLYFSVFCNKIKKLLITMAFNIDVALELPILKNPQIFNSKSWYLLSNNKFSNWNIRNIKKFIPKKRKYYLHLWPDDH